MYIYLYNSAPQNLYYRQGKETILSPIMQRETRVFELNQESTLLEIHGQDGSLLKVTLKGTLMTGQDHWYEMTLAPEDNTSSQVPIMAQGYSMQGVATLHLRKSQEGGIIIGAIDVDP